MSRSFTVRLTPARYDALIEQAQAQGFSGPGTYIRAMVLERPEASRRDLIALLGVMGRIGHRLIELNRQLDAQATPSPFLEDQLAEVLGFLRFSLGETLIVLRSLPCRLLTSHDFTRIEAACRAIELRHGWTPDNGRFDAQVGEDDGKLVVRLVPKPPDVWEARTRQREAGRGRRATARERSGIGTDRPLAAAMPPHLRQVVVRICSEARSWDELHGALQPLGLAYVRHGSGARLILRGTSAFLRPSHLAAAIGWTRLAARLGTYTPPGNHLLPPGLLQSPIVPDPGATVGQLAKADPETDFERGIRGVGLLLTRIMAVVVLFIFVANLLMERPLFDSLLFSVALAVGLTPELLPAIVSVTLSAGARRMASHGVICRKLNAIANLGAVDVLCTDKTGTLTHGIVKLDAALGPDGVAHNRTFRLAAINARLQAGMKNPLDAAIAEAADERGADTGDVTRVDEIAFDFQRKRLSLVVDDGAQDGTHLIATKGAFDQVLACCSQVRDPSGTPCQIDTEPLRKFYAGMGAKGFRVLGVASRRAPAQPRYNVSIERDMIFEGYLLFFDPLKDGIVESLRSLTDLGIAIKIISGDNRHVAANVAQAVGLDPSRVLTGTDLADLSDEAFLDLAQTTDAFAEIDPQQKERIVRALQGRGHAVAFLGDGINEFVMNNAFKQRFPLFDGPGRSA